MRWLEGDELHVTLHASPAEPALRTFVQPTPAPLTHPLDAELSHLLPPGGARTAVAGDVRRGAQGGWATPLVHPVLDASARQQATSELLLHEHATERVIEGLNSNLFVVSSRGPHSAYILLTACTRGTHESVHCVRYRSAPMAACILHPRRKVRTQAACAAFSCSWRRSPAFSPP